MSLHSFNPDIAEKVGVNAAVIYQNFLFWTEKNHANGRHCYDGHAWTYNSRKAFVELFPYLSEKQIRTAIDKLVDAGLVIRGNYNKRGFDKTVWYALTASAEWENRDSIEGPDDLPSGANPLAANGQPIPEIVINYVPQPQQSDKVSE